MTRAAHVRTRVEVAAGGAAGTLLRAGAAAATVAVVGPGVAPVVAVVLAGNVTGAFALGWLVARATSDVRAARLLPALGSGGLGSLTTFSALALQLGDLVASGAVLAAGTLAAVSLLAGVAAARAGWRVGRRPRPAVRGRQVRR